MQDFVTLQKLRSEKKFRFIFSIILKSKNVSAKQTFSHVNHSGIFTQPIDKHRICKKKSSLGR